MKSKYFIGLIIGIIIIISIGTVSVIANNPWGAFKKKDGIIRQQQGLSIYVPTEKDKLEIINSIDPKTGQPTKKIDLQVKDYEKQIKTLKLKENGNEKEILISYVKKGEKNIIVNDPSTTPYVFTPIPNSNNFLTEINKTIYIIDIDKSIISNVLSDTVDGYDKDTLNKKYDKESSKITWGANPSINLSGTKMIFYTDRSISRNDPVPGEIWCKNILTGEEKFLRKGSYSPLGWDSNDNVYLKEFETITKLNVDNGKYQELSKAYFSQFSYPYLIYSSEAKSVSIFDVKKNTDTVIKNEDINFVDLVSINDDSNCPWFAVLNRPDTKNPNPSLFFININTLKIKSIQPSSDFSIQGCSWQDKDNLIVNIKYKGTSNESSYIINTNEF